MSDIRRGKLVSLHSLCNKYTGNRTNLVIYHKVTSFLMQVVKSIYVSVLRQNCWKNTLRSQNKFITTLNCSCFVCSFEHIDVQERTKLHELVNRPWQIFDSYSNNNIILWAKGGKWPRYLHGWLTDTAKSLKNLKKYNLVITSWNRHIPGLPFCIMHRVDVVSLHPCAVFCISFVVQVTMSSTH